MLLRDDDDEREAMILDWLRTFLSRTPDPTPVESAIVTVPDVTDIRAIANPWRVDAKGKRWSVRAKRRKWSAIRKVVFHQTATVCGERPARYATLGAHYAIPASGAIIQVYDDEWLIWHANLLSPDSIGIELDGRFCGVLGDLSTIWDDPSTKVREQPTELTDAQVAAALALGRTLAARIRENGGTFDGFFTHRQSSANRRNDPGAEPYQRIVRPLNDEFETYRDDDWTIGSGRPIPAAWDSRRSAKY